MREVGVGIVEAGMYAEAKRGGMDDRAEIFGSGSAGRVSLPLDIPPVAAAAGPIEGWWT